MLGTCDGFIEARVVRGSVKTGTFDHGPNDEVCLWSAKTQIVHNSMDPKWNEKFVASVPGYHNLTLQLILWDSNAPLPDVAIAQAWVDLLEVAKGAPGGPEVDHKLRFSKLPGIAPVADFKKTQLKLTLAFEQAFSK